MRKEQGMLHIHKLHAKYGPVVQISPNEVSITELAVVKKIYLNDNYPKEFSHLKSNSSQVIKVEKGFYSQFGNFSNRNLFSTGDTKEHINKRKPLQKIYSKTFVLQHSDFLSTKINSLVSYLVASKGKDVDVYALFGALAMDVVTGFEFGFDHSSDFLAAMSFQDKYETKDKPETKDKHETQDENETQDKYETHESNHGVSVFDSFRDSSSLWFWVCMTPQLYDWVAKVSGKDKTMVVGRDWIWNKINQVAASYVSEDLKRQDSTMSVLYDRYDRDLKRIGSELADHTIAGADTTQTTLTYLMWHLARPVNKVWKQKLFEEIQSTFACDQNTGCIIINDYNKLDTNMPVLNAIIKENFRLHAAIPGSERRFVPNGEGLKINGYKLHPGTVVSTQPYSLHRSSVFGDDIDTFKPERWLPFDNESTQEYNERIKEFERHMMTFGQGNRMCLGMHLAVTEIKAATASVFGNVNLQNYSISSRWCKNIEAENNPVLMGFGDKLVDKKAERKLYLGLSDVEKMRMADSYTTRPLFDECWMAI